MILFVQISHKDFHTTRRRFPTKRQFSNVERLEDVHSKHEWKIHCGKNQSSMLKLLNIFSLSVCAHTQYKEQHHPDKCSHFMLKHFPPANFHAFLWEWHRPSLPHTPQPPSSFCFFSHTLCSWNIFYLSSFSIVGNEYLASSYGNGIKEIFLSMRMP